ncbi:MAG: hypothetical protein OEW12_07855, partial [Deltaproteobacteria bacterium]|nr:hypothetical protein [Deltaproteobacteria bacterium]
MTPSKAIRLVVVMAALALGWLSSFASGAWAVSPVSPHPVTAPPLVLTDGETVYRMSLHADYMEEPSGQWSLQQVTSPSGARNWKPWEQDTISIGFSSSAYWFRIAIDNRTRQM